MIEIGTRILIEGIPYIVEMAEKGINGRWVIVVHHDCSVGTEIRISMKELLDNIDCITDKMVISKLIIDWFISEKLKSGINTSQILSIKMKPTYAESQIRKLIKSGEPLEHIIEVLAYAITNKFWSGVLNTSINTIAIDRDDGVTLYQKIKNSMIKERHSEQSEFHQPTEDEIDGVIIVES